MGGLLLCNLLAAGRLSFEDLGEAVGQAIETGGADVLIADDVTVGGVALSASVDAAEADESRAFRRSEAFVPHDLVEGVTERIGGRDDVLGSDVS
jgi:hypothetical protein